MGGRGSSSGITAGGGSLKGLSARTGANEKINKVVGVSGTVFSSWNEVSKSSKMIFGQMEVFTDCFIHLTVPA